MIPDDDIDSLWKEIRPVRLPPADPKVVAPPEPPPEEPRRPHPFNSARILLSAAGHHGTQCHGEFTSLERDIGFRCTCGVVFRIGLADARRTARGLFGYLQTVGFREATAMRLTHEPQQFLLELENEREP